MKFEGSLFIGCAIFFGAADIVYWYYSKDPTGTTALALSVALAFLTGFYLLFTGRRLPERPVDLRPDLGVRVAVRDGTLTGVSVCPAREGPGQDDRRDDSGGTYANGWTVHFLGWRKLLAGSVTGDPVRVSPAGSHLEAA